MNKEEIKKIAKEEFINNVMKNIDSALIFTYISNLEKENNRLNNIINELIEDIPHLLKIINRNEKDIKIYQDEWLAVSSLEYKLKELKGDE